MKYCGILSVNFPSRYTGLTSGGIPEEPQYLFIELLEHNYQLICTLLGTLNDNFEELHSEKIYLRKSLQYAETSKGPVLEDLDSVHIFL